MRNLSPLTPLTPLQELSAPRRCPERAARAHHAASKRPTPGAAHPHVVLHRRAARQLLGLLGLGHRGGGWEAAFGFPAAGACSASAAAGPRLSATGRLHVGAGDAPTVPASARGRAPGPPGQWGQDPPVEGAEGPRALHPGACLLPPPRTRPQFFRKSGAHAHGPRRRGPRWEMQFCGLGSPKPRPGVDYQPYKAPRATRAQSPATGFAALATVTGEAEVG